MALIVIKFILVPVFSWQQAQLIQIQAKAKRLAKANQVIKRAPIIEQALSALQQKNNSLQALYFNQPSLNAFKLQLQQQVESLFAQHHLVVRNFSWAAEVIGDITEERAKISFKGTTKDFAQLQINLARMPKLLTIAQWDLNIKKMDEKSLGTINGRLLLIVYNLSSKNKESSFEK